MEQNKNLKIVLGKTYTEKTVSFNQRNIFLLYDQWKNFFEAKKVSIIQKNALWSKEIDLFTLKEIFSNQQNFLQFKEIFSLIVYQRKNFFWHFFDIRSMKKFLWIKESFVNSKKFSLIQRNRFAYIKGNFFESTKLSSIQRNAFFDRVSQKLFSRCSAMFTE